VALGLKASGLVGLTEAYAATTKPPVLWLQAQSCTGCSVSFLNSVYYATADQLLTQTLDLKYHPNIMAAADDLAISAANAAYTNGGYILIVEGAIPTGASGKYCELWPGLTALSGVQQFASKAAYVLAVGTCAAYGGISAGNPNPTAARSVKAVLGTKPVVNIPGCPTHPDWVVGTVAYILQNGRAPALDSLYRPVTYFSTTVHERCPRRGTDDDGGLGGSTCMREAGCKGPETRADCPIRKWNSPGTSKTGVNWCIGSSFPCHGCTEPKFPNSFVPFLDSDGDDD
jgi:NiFe hydrogenase small subunit HydA